MANLLTVLLLLVGCIPHAFTHPLEFDVLGMRVEDKGYMTSGVAMEVSADEPLTLTLFGNQINRTSAVYLTTADRCEDWRKATKTHKNSNMTLIDEHTLRVHWKEGLVFQEKENYRLCTAPTFAERRSATSLEIKTTVKSTLFMPIYVQMPLLALLLSLSALFSGLNLGLMSLDSEDLKLIEEHSTDEKEKKYAKNIRPIRQRGNFLLCTLLIGNTVINTTIALLTSNMFDQLQLEEYARLPITVIVPSFAIVVLAEIIPQALCHRRGLAIGSRTRYATMVFMGMTAPLSYPISKVLDWLLGGDQPRNFDRKKLAALIKQQMGDQHDQDVANMMIKAIDLGEHTVGKTMTSVGQAFMLSTDDKLDYELMALIVEQGYTRIPVYTAGNRNNVTAVLNVKDLAPINPESNLSVGYVSKLWKRSSQVCFVTEEMSVKPLMSEMIKGHHIAIVIRFDESTSGYSPVGLITLEDVIEEVVGEILDETDAQANIKQCGDHRERSTLNLFQRKPTVVHKLSVQLELQVAHYLLYNVAAFDRAGFDPHAVIKLVAKARVEYLQQDLKLYSRSQSSSSFILMLEGSADVVVGADDLHWQAGPFHHFGQTLLNITHKRVTEHGPDANIADVHFVPDFDVIAKRKSKYLLITPALFRDVLAKEMRRRGKENASVTGDTVETSTEPDSTEKSTQAATPSSTNSRRSHTTHFVASSRPTPSPPHRPNSAPQTL